MAQRWIVFWGIAFLLNSFAWAKDICIQEGQVERIAFSNAQSVWVEKSAVMKVQPEGQGLSIKALKSGQSRLRVNETYLRVNVLTSETFEFSKAIDAAIKMMKGLNWKCENGEVIVYGRLLRLDDWIRIQKLYVPGTIYRVQFEMSESVLLIAQKYFSEKLKNDQISVKNLSLQNQAKIKISNDPVIIQKYKNTLHPFGFWVEVDSSQIELAPLVRVKITVAEIKKEKTLKYGVNWPSVLSAQQLQGRELIDFNLQTLEQDGFGKILASPNILCRSGKEAEFVAGGEFPIKIMNLRMQDVIWKRYGVILKIKPVADSSGRMSIAIETEVSTIDGSKTVDGVPGLFTNRIQSHFDLTESKTIALSGLIKSEDSKASQGVPGLGGLPILGPLFASRDFRENRTELVIFVQPEIVDLETEDNKINLPQEFQ